ncbi:MAG: 5'/3'-nucleotidase SurE [Candidatus Dadabacteria bacterium]|nr:5'/3'-nucleotidase SurE [Candidatus Dadabacteria bacterium]NIS09226.1 5'/3'-nucleotidase SurE [Candidatus Dadabacteria bacterium]NIV42510.1 5'/3'-nucleotidase SurE [Candidatus Dadabacteria bacterium]NIY22502.1 5'/3'-nucleotidase SurE [Candidatus Dadabacteria bacterium]
MMKKTILLSNDDGINSAGLSALAGALEHLGEIYIVAPDREQSASSHALSIHRPLRMDKVAENSYSVDGTPTDCINLAINGLLKEKKPDLVVSGINKGENLGDDITYSGTVSAAIEGTLLAVPSVALSAEGRKDFNFDAACHYSAKIAQYVLQKGLPADTLLNVNIPKLDLDDIKGIKITRQGKRIYNDAVVEKIDPRGREYYWIGGDELGSVELDNSDIDSVKSGYVSVTPIKLDLTDYGYIKFLEQDFVKLKKHA